MSYDYQSQRSKLFTEGGMKLTLAIRDEAFRLIAIAGAFMSSDVTRNAKGLPGAWDTFEQAAVLDYLVETKCIREVTSGTAGQDRVFVAGEKWRAR